jgi:hypothetical protein
MLESNRPVTPCAAAEREGNADTWTSRPLELAGAAKSRFHWLSRRHEAAVSLSPRRRSHVLIAWIWTTMDSLGDDGAMILDCLVHK